MVTSMAFGAWGIGGWRWEGSEEQAAIRAIQAAYDTNALDFILLLKERNTITTAADPFCVAPIHPG